MKEQKLLNYLKDNPFVLAPMAGITDSPFRTFMREQGCGIVITELVSATGLKFSSERTRRLMQFDPIQSPVGIQLFGEDLDHLAYAAAEVEQMGADFVDLNFGCPVPKVTKKGAGSAVLKDLVFLGQVLRAVKSAVSIPVTIKVRTGWDDSSRNSSEVARVAHEEGIAWMAIHGRTRAQGYSGQADWEYIQSIKSASPIPIIGNGDITSAELATQRLDQSQCDGVMIGRGCLKNPWIFLEARALRNGHARPLHKDFAQLFERLASHVREFSDERLMTLQIKKFAAWFSSGYPGSSQFRKQLFQSEGIEQLSSLVDQFFGELSAIRPEDTSSEPFLMGGHG